MTYALLLAKTILQLFLIMASGFLLVKIRILKSGDSKVLSSLCLYLILPCVILNAFQVEYTPDIRNGLMLAFLSAFVLHALLFLLCFLLKKPLKLSNVEQASLVYSNAGNLIIPIVTQMFGPEWVIYSTAFMTTQLVLLWSHGRMLVSGQHGFDPKKILLNCNMIAVLCGIVMFFFRIRLPGALGGFCSSVASMTGPVSMLITGMLIAGIDLVKVFSSRRVYLVSALRLIVAPLALLTVLKLSGLSSLHPQGGTILMISLLAAITPSASTVTQMALVYHADENTAGSVNVLTTLLCIVTMPVMILLWQL